MTGAPVGWQFDLLIQVAHHLAQDHPQHLLAFGFALEISGNKKHLSDQDWTGKWARKRKVVWEKIVARDPDFMPDERWLPALSFLFPEVGERVTEFLSIPPKPNRTQLVVTYHTA